MSAAFVFPGGQLFCQVTKELEAGEELLAFLSSTPDSSSSSSSSSSLGQLSPALSLVAQKQPVVKEESLYPAALHSDIQLLPQQAGMAAILATAIVNSEFCGECATILLRMVSIEGMWNMVHD